eukprot:593363_1
MNINIIAKHMIHTIFCQLMDDGNDVIHKLVESEDSDEYDSEDSDETHDIKINKSKYAENKISAMKRRKLHGSTIDMTIDSDDGIVSKPSKPTSILSKPTSIIRPTPLTPTRTVKKHKSKKSKQNRSNKKKKKTSRQSRNKRKNTHTSARVQSYDELLRTPITENEHYLRLCDTQ